MARVLFGPAPSFSGGTYRRDRRRHRRRRHRPSVGRSPLRRRRTSVSSRGGPTLARSSARWNALSIPPTLHAPHSSQTQVSATTRERPPPPSPLPSPPPRRPS